MYCELKIAIDIIWNLKWDIIMLATLNKFRNVSFLKKTCVMKKKIKITLGRF